MCCSVFATPHGVFGWSHGFAGGYNGDGLWLRYTLWTATSVGRSSEAPAVYNPDIPSDTKYPTDVSTQLIHMELA